MIFSSFFQEKPYNLFTLNFFGLTLGFFSTSIYFLLLKRRQFPLSSTQTEKIAKNVIDF